MVLASGLALFLSNQFVPAQAAGARAAIEAGEKKYIGAYNRGDAAAQAALYANDAQVFVADGEIVKGRQAIEKRWKKDIGSGGKKQEGQTLEVEEHGEWAHEISSEGPPLKEWAILDSPSGTCQPKCPNSRVAGRDRLVAGW